MACEEIKMCGRVYIICECGKCYTETPREKLERLLREQAMERAHKRIEELVEKSP